MEKFTPNLEEINQEIENSKEKELSSIITLFAKNVDTEFNIDENIIKYSLLRLNAQKLFAESGSNSSPDDRKNWQSKLQIIDSDQRKLHDKIAKEFINSNFFNGELSDTYIGLNDKEKFETAREYVKHLSSDIYMPLILSVGKGTIKIPEKQNLQSIYEKFSDQNDLLKYHELDNFLFENKTTVNSDIIFNEKVDKAIIDFIDTNESIIRNLERMEPGQEKTIIYLQNADENKTNKHRAIVFALMETGILPTISSEWLYGKKWSDKQNNPIRKIAENFATTYSNISALKKR